MIDELVKAADAIEKAGIKSVDWHPKLKVLPKPKKKIPCVRIWLTADGHIHDIEGLPEELVTTLRKYEPDNGKSLPAINVLPLYRIVKSKEEISQASRGAAGEKTKVEWTNEFLALTFDEKSRDDFWSKTREVLTQSLGRVKDELRSICNDDLLEGETLHRFLETSSKVDVEQFQREYDEKLQQKFVEGTLPYSMICYFVDEARKRKEDSDTRAPIQKFSIFLDVYDYKDYPVAHEKSISRLNSLLWNKFSDSEGSKEGVSSTSKDAYGLGADGLDEKLPEVALPVLGGVKLRSQVKAVPAQARYDLCESKTFHVGSETRKRTKRALEWLSSPEHDGKTYGVAGDKELLFAYPLVLPKSKIPLTKMLGAQKDVSYQKQEKFEGLAKSVIGQLKGLGKTVSDAQLEIFCLRKMDKARTKVVYYYNVTVDSLEEASIAWNKGCQNIPLLDLRDWSEKKDETGKCYPVIFENETVFPIKLHRYLNTMWKRNGEQAGKVKIFEPADGLRLLLDSQNNTLPIHMLERFMLHAQGYFLFLCHCMGKNEIASSLPGKKIYPGVLGLLLSKSRRKKEEYMGESAFLLGRCLRITDEIHRLYCEVVRKKDLPPELCGSSLLVSMMESPTMTLSQLAMRSAPYIKWARGGGGKGDKAGLVWYWLKQWEEIADQLHTLSWPKRLVPEERAQLFLGYMASFPKNEKQGKGHADLNKQTGEGE